MNEAQARTLRKTCRELNEADEALREAPEEGPETVKAAEDYMKKLDLHQHQVRSVRQHGSL